MIRRLSTILIALSLPALAQTPPSNQDRQRLIDQKAKLVESLSRSRAPQDTTKPASLEASSRQAVENARKLADEGNYDEATRQLDVAIKAITNASRRLASDEGLSAEDRRKLLKEQQEQVATYRAAIAELAGQNKTASAAKALLNRLDSLSREANELAGANRLADANRKMADVYKLAVSELSNLRAGQEVILALKFDTPADEYKYEQKRFTSNQIMVNMMIGDGRAEGDKRTQVDQFLEEARQFQRSAEKEADQSRYREAVGQMEQGTARLVRALQSMGVPAF